MRFPKKPYAYAVCFAVLPVYCTLSLLSSLVLFGCTQSTMTESTPTAAAPTPTQSSVAATVSPTAEPEMTIEDDGDITLRSDIASVFTPQQYSFEEAPTVLIYHTHATEAYRKSESDAYVETELGRTDDNAFNVVGLGELLADALIEQGFRVIHDTTNVEQPELVSAYSRSLSVMQKYEDMDIYIDLHRNASKQKGRSDNTVTLFGTDYAKMFFVVGTGIGTYEDEYDVLPDWRNNYTFALSVGNAFGEDFEQLIRPIRLKDGRYNQHMGLCLLAEVGTNADALAAAQNTIPIFAKALRQVCVFTS